MTMRLAPSMTPDTQFFWDGLKNHTLLIQCCTQCEVVRHPPRPMCPQCNSVEWHTIESFGRGRVFSFVMPQHPAYPWFEYPYIVALIDLDEGIRLVSNLCGIAPEDASIGMRVEVFYEHFDNDLVLAQFQPAAQQ
jgi:uncharacterized OB-fold protein